MKKVSIIIPIYNSEDSIKKCIESVLRQSYKNLEIILLNDGSKDKSLSICKDYKSNDNRIVLIDKENSGVSNTRNIGIEKATGHYLMFIDSDDYIEKNLIESLVLQIEKDKSDIIFYGYTNVINGRFNKVSDGTWNTEDKRKVIGDLFKKDMFGYAWNKIILASIVKEKKIFFDEHRNLFEDQYFFFQYIKYVKKISVSGEVGYFYVFSSNSLSNNYSKIAEKTNDQDEMFYTLIVFFEEMKINEFDKKMILFNYAMMNYYMFLKDLLRDNNNIIILEMKKFEETKMYNYFISQDIDKKSKKDKIIVSILKIKSRKLKINTIKLMMKLKLMN